jgi:predicted metal-dependent phosphoesterase TrpH
MPIDLHLHTQASDGTWTAAELTAKVKAARLKAFSVTDHDCTDSLPEAAENAQINKVQFIPGVEISSSYTKDIALHILGYGIDSQHPELRRVLAINQAAWEQSERDSIVNLSRLGIHVNKERYDYWRNDNSQGRWPMLNTLREMGVVNDIEDYFEEYFGQGKPACVDINFCSPLDVVKAIRQAGGAAILAHPGLYKHKNDLIYRNPDFIQEIIGLGIVGLEAYNSAHTEEITKELIEIAQKAGLIITGGSDCHGDFTGRPLGVPVVDDKYLKPLLEKINL